MTAAPILFSLVASAPATARWSPGMVVLGLGIGSFYPTATTAGVTSVDESQSSLAGGIVYMFQIAGGSIGLGLTTTVFSSSTRRSSTASRRPSGSTPAIALVGLVISVLFVGGRCSARQAGRNAT